MELSTKEIDSGLEEILRKGEETLREEVWVEYIPPGVQTKILVSSMGRVKLKKNITCGHRCRGYLRVIIEEGKGKKSFSVHSLVLAAFRGEKNLPIQHKDGDRENNCLQNLKYVCS